MSDKKTTAKILTLIMSLILMLAGCGAGNGTAEESGNDASGGDGRVRNVKVGGKVGADFADPYGQGRITIIQ